MQQVPTSFQLEQNYPNPFNPCTVIRYRLSKEAHALLRVHDLLGAHIETIVDDMKSAGSYEIMWHAKGLSSGTYFCSLQVGGILATKRMILLR